VGRCLVHVCRDFTGATIENREPQGKEPTTLRSLTAMILQVRVSPGNGPSKKGETNRGSRVKTVLPYLRRGNQKTVEGVAAKDTLLPNIQKKGSRQNLQETLKKALDRSCWIRNPKPAGKFGEDDWALAARTPNEKSSLERRTRHVKRSESSRPRGGYASKKSSVHRD